MKDSDFDCEVMGKSVSFYHNTKTHRYEIVIDHDVYNPLVVTKARGAAIIKFLEHMAEC